MKNSANCLHYTYYDKDLEVTKVIYVISKGNNIYYFTDHKTDSMAMRVAAFDILTKTIDVMEFSNNVKLGVHEKVEKNSGAFIGGFKIGGTYAKKTSSSDSRGTEYEYSFGNKVVGSLIVDENSNLQNIHPINIFHPNLGLPIRIESDTCIVEFQSAVDEQTVIDAMPDLSGEPKFSLDAIKRFVGDKFDLSIEEFGKGIQKKGKAFFDSFKN